MLRSIKRIHVFIYKNSKKLYTTSFKKYLVLTNATLTSTLFFASDFVEQKIFERRKTTEVRRLLAFTSCGFLFGMYGHYWYRIMSKIPTVANFPNRQALLYQIMFSPLEYFSFYTFIGAVEGETVEEIKHEIKNKFLFTYALDWLIYYPFLYCNIRYVPLHLRVAIDNMFGFCWTVFLSYVKHHSAEDWTGYFHDVVTNSKNWQSNWVFDLISEMNA